MGCPQAGWPQVCACLCAILLHMSSARAVVPPPHTASSGMAFCGASPASPHLGVAAAAALQRPRGGVLSPTKQPCAAAAVVCLHTVCAWAATVFALAGGKCRLVGWGGWQRWKHKVVAMCAVGLVGTCRGTPESKKLCTAVVLNGNCFSLVAGALVAGVH